MSRRRVYLILFLILLVTSGLVLLLFMAGRINSYSWTENYKASNKGPYGTYVIAELLKNYLPGEDFKLMDKALIEDLPLDQVPGTYVFIGQSQFIDSADAEHLLDFVAAGNNAFIAARAFPSRIMDHLYVEDCPDAPWDGLLEFRDTAAHLNLLHPEARLEADVLFKYIFRDKKIPYDWQYFPYGYFCDLEDGFVQLGVIEEDLINFVRLPYGDGFFYFHSNPIAFANIQLLDRVGLDYAEGVFSNFAEGSVFWDNYNKSPVIIRDSGGGTARPPSRTPMQYVLSQPPLAWAWYILVSMALLYLLFRTKRRQRIIPVLEGNTNTSLEFLQTIGQLYFLQQDHKQLALQQVKLLLGYIRDHYNMATRDLDKEFQELLSKKSEVPLADIEGIFLMHRNIKSSSIVTEDTLIELNRRIEKFYNHCK